MRHFKLGIALLLLASCANLQGGSGDCLLRIHGVEEQGHLVLDGIDHGPIRADHIFPEMSSGMHVIELRRDTLLVSRTAIQIPSGSRADIHIDVPRPMPSPPIVRAPPNSKPAPSNPEPASHAEDAEVLEPLEEETAPEPAPRRPNTSHRSESPPPETQSSSPEPLEDSRTWARRVLDVPSAPTSTERSPESQLPTQPPRDETLRAMTFLHTPIAACADGQHGTATVRLRVMGATGRVSEVQVTGHFAGTPVAACIERVARTASFSPFGRTWIDINYPFRL